LIYIVIPVKINAIKYLILLISLQLFAITAHSTVFTVINNSDSGIGSLRDALKQAAANGTDQTDLITFNFPDHTETGRTITVMSQLPSLSSNLTVDASTQPGAVFGVSTSKVKILVDKDFSGARNVMLLEEVHDVKIYGFYIKYDIICVGDYDHCYYGQGIAVRDCKDIEIGAAGKGNVIIGFQFNLGINVSGEGGQIHLHCVNLNIKANFFEIEPDGKTLQKTHSTGIQVGYVNGEINIGGTPAEGNLFPNGFSIIQINTENDKDWPEMFTLPATFNIRNNKIGVDYTESQTFRSSGIWFGVHTPDGKNTVFIEDNIISSTNEAGISLTNNLNEISIKRNFIGTDRSLGNKLPYASANGITVFSCKNVKIGSDNPVDRNYIANCKPVSIYQHTTVSVNKNSFFCVKDMYPMHFDYGETFDYPVIQISTITGTKVSGTATPNSKIELFYTDKCGSCAPETYFGSTTTDASGNWHYEGAIQGTVIASATLKGATSEFTKAEVDFTQVTIKNTCPDYGSITGAVPSSFTDLSWVNESGKVVGKAADLLNVPAGKYQLKVGNGDCVVTTPWYEIKTGASVDASAVKIKDASCSAANGSVNGLAILSTTPTDLIYSWRNADGIEVGSALDLTNIKPGSYLLNISLADNSCTLSYGPVVIKNTIGPDINQSNIRITATKCGKAEGSIKGVKATGLGVLKFEWRNEVGKTIASTLDLLDQPAGNYSLSILDESACSALISTLIIPEINGITINDVGTVSPETCGQHNGSISGILVSGATSYQWFDESDRVVGTDINLKNVFSGKYYLVASNSGCIKASKQYTIDSEVPITVNSDHAQVMNDHCGLGIGTITGIKASANLPLSYTWTNENGKVVGSEIDLKNVSKGTYTLNIKDTYGCGWGTQFEIENQVEIPEQPIVNDLQLCGSGDAVLIAGNVKADYGYKLYENEYSLIPLDDQHSGRFNINVNENRSFYVSQYIGTCESSRAKVNVKVGYTALNIPNAFSPNNDGNNDNWIIKGIENYPKTSVMVFNRYGAKVFESSNYQKPFDGNRNGSPLPIGVYFYVIKINEKCSTISGSLTLLR
jgi:gliding motility-associated-like protein